MSAEPDQVRRPPERIELGCTAEQYRAEIGWFQQLAAETMDVYVGRPMPSSVVRCVYYNALRKLTKEEFERILQGIREMHLIVLAHPIGHIMGVAYRLYTNPQADQQADVPPGRNGLWCSREVFMLHWDYIEPELLPLMEQAERGLESERKLTAFFHLMEPISHSDMNRKWLEYYNLGEPTTLRSCEY